MKSLLAVISVPHMHTEVLGMAASGSTRFTVPGTAVAPVLNVSTPLLDTL